MFFELPFALRVPIGLTKLYNSLSVHKKAVKIDANGIAIFINCRDDFDVKIEQDKSEYHASQNIGQWLFPKNLKIKVGDVEYMRRFLEALNYEEPYMLYRWLYKEKYVHEHSKEVITILD